LTPPMRYVRHPWPPWLMVLLPTIIQPGGHKMRKFPKYLR
jgi:hypothetical protein